MHNVSKFGTYRAPATNLFDLQGLPNLQSEALLLFGINSSHFTELLPYSAFGRLLGVPFSGGLGQTFGLNYWTHFGVMG